MNQVLCRLWLENPIYSTSLIDPYEMKGGFFGEIDTIEKLKEFLQCAIQVELSTLPPYLSALYSMAPNNLQNESIISLISDITHEEMLHMCLACSLLLSLTNNYDKKLNLGKRNIDIPRIAYKDVVNATSFPRIGLASNKTVRVLPNLPLELRPMNMTTVQTFMQIEAPAKFTIDGGDNDGGSDSKDNSDSTKNNSQAKNVLSSEQLRLFLNDINVKTGL